MTSITLKPRSMRHRFARTLICVAAIVVGAIAINVVGISIMGDVNSWNRWLPQHRGHFAFGRLLLYAATGFGWWWMRARILSREPEPETRTRLLRAEIAAVLAIVALEISTFLQMSAT